MADLSPMVEDAKAKVDKLLKDATTERSKLLLAGKGEMENGFADLQGKAEAASEQAATWQTLMGAAETQLDNIQGNARALWQTQIGHVGVTEKTLEATLGNIQKKMQEQASMLEAALNAVNDNLQTATGNTAKNIG